MSGIRVHLQNAQTDVTAIRAESFRGRAYTVVPVVALVEGVLQGLSAEEPEFAPADEFGKFPQTWNGRPITLGHPRRNGVLCSANDPDIREEYEFGFMANTILEDDKLKCEAWLDDEVIDSKGGEFLSTKTRLLDGEMVEVSTGLFCDVLASKGTHNGAKYNRSWANVVPDHLAFLEEGTQGACSVADGCGAPRLNQLKLHSAATNKDGEIVTGMPTNLGAPIHNHDSCCDACAKGDDCVTQLNTNSAEGENNGNSASQDAADTETVISKPEDQPGSSEEAVEGSTEGGDSGAGNEGQPEVVPEPAEEGLEDLANKPLELEVTEEEFKASQAASETLGRLVDNAVAPEVTFENARTIVQDALRLKYPNGSRSSCDCYYYDYTYILAMTADQVVWERRVEGVNSGYQNVAINYSVDANGGVTFTGEPVPVNLLVSIVPKPETISANEGNPGADQQQKEDQMATNANANDSGEAGGEVSANGAGSTPVQIRTLEAFLADAPPEVAAVVQEGIALRTQKKNKLVKGILAHSQLFTETELEAKDIPELEKLHTMAQPVADFSGRAMPRFAGPSSEGVSANAQRENQNTVPAAPKAFEVNPRRKADYSDQNSGSAAAA